MFVFVFSAVLGLGMLSMVNLSAASDQAAATQKNVLAPMQNVRVDQVIGQLILRRIAMAPTAPCETPSWEASPASTAR